MPQNGKLLKDNLHQTYYTQQQLATSLQTASVNTILLIERQRFTTTDLRKVSTAPGVNLFNQFGRLHPTPTPTPEEITQQLRISLLEQEIPFTGIC